MTEQEIISDLQCQYYELYKDVHGIKPRWINVSDPYWQDIDTLQQKIKALEDELRVVMSEEAQEQKEAIARFEAKVASLRAAGAKDDATAVQWLLDADEPNREWQDKGLFCYNWGLPYNYLSNCEE